MLTIDWVNVNLWFTEFMGALIEMFIWIEWFASNEQPGTLDECNNGQHKQKMPIRPPLAPKCPSVRQKGILSVMIDWLDVCQFV